MSGAFYGGSKLSLVFRADSGFIPAEYFPPFAQKSKQTFGIFIIGKIFLLAKLAADFFDSPDIFNSLRFSVHCFALILETGFWKLEIEI